MRKTAASRLWLVIAVACAPPASAGEAPRFAAAWPLFWWAKDPGRTELEVLGPLFFYRQDAGGLQYGLRPLFAFHRRAEPPKGTWEFLYPLSYFRAEPGARRQFVLPLYFHSRHRDGAGRPVSATVIFPLFWWGSHPVGGPWFVVPLVGGTYKGLLGQDSGTHVSLLYNRMRRGDYVTHHVLWPLFSWSSDGKGRQALRIWPLYARAEERRDGKIQWWNGYVLWPFFTYGRREASETKDAASFFMVFPLFGRALARDGHSGSVEVLGPLFRYAWNRRTGYREWRLPWPLVLGKRSQSEQTTNLWPLWGRRQWKGGSESYYLWPLVHVARIRSRRKHTDELRVFPLLTVATTTTSPPPRPRDTAAKEPAGAPRRRSFRLLWPLWRSRTRREGTQWSREANSLQFAWMKDSESFDRTYNALLGLFEHRASSDGRRATRLLWRLLRFERGPSWRRVQLGPLATWTRSGSLTRSSYLLGLVQTGTRQGRRGWRILFIPFGASLAPSQ